MSGAAVATPTAAYNFFKKSGLSSGGMTRFLPPPEVPPGRPAMIHAIEPRPGTKMMIINQDQRGRLLI